MGGRRGPAAGAIADAGLVAAGRCASRQRRPSTGSGVELDPVENKGTRRRMGKPILKNGEALIERAAIRASKWADGGKSDGSAGKKWRDGQKGEGTETDSQRDWNKERRHEGSRSESGQSDAPREGSETGRLAPLGGNDHVGRQCTGQGRTRTASSSIASRVPYLSSRAGSERGRLPACERTLGRAAPIEEQDSARKARGVFLR